MSKESLLKDSYDTIKHKTLEIRRFLPFLKVLVRKSTLSKFELINFKAAVQHFRHDLTRGI